MDHRTANLDFVRDPLWVRGERGLTLLAATPVRFFRVTESGTRVLDALEHGQSLPAGHEPLTSRLDAAGAIHPVPRRAAVVEDVTVVIPAFVASATDVARLRGLVDSLAPLGVVVVDDCSPVDPCTELAGSRAVVTRLDTNRGPGAARNAGLALVTTPVVVFVDLDVEVEPDQVLLLAGIIGDGRASLVAPRVGTAQSSKLRRGIGLGLGAAIAAYETHRSPLDMGPVPAVVRPGARVPYVPAAVLACDAAALRAVGGFDETMRTGEDVDLVWRLTDAGSRCRYAPSVDALHVPRATFTQFVRQRVSYGRSAAQLARQHGARVSPLRAHFIAIVPVLLALLAYPLSALLAAIVALSWLSASLRFARVGLRRTVGLTRTSLLNVGSMTARAVRREWWPVVAAAGLFWERAAFALVAAHCVSMIVRLLRDKPRRVLTHIVLGVIDDVAYGTGVWIGAFGHRTWRFLLPAVGLHSHVRHRET